MFDSKVALITGAATGMGRACAEKLANDSFAIAANYRSKKDQVEAVLKSFAPGEHILVHGDIRDPDVPPLLIEEVVNKFGRLDVLINAAGTFSEHDISTIGYDKWLAAMKLNIETNLEGPMNLAFCAGQQMLKQGSGTIINITSRGAFRGEPDAPAYGANKAGLNSASQSLAKALAPSGISVFAIAPGWVDTPLASQYLDSSASAAIKAQSPLNRVGTPQEIAEFVSFLASGKAEYMTGAIIDMNGASYLRN